MRVAILQLDTRSNALSHNLKRAKLLAEQAAKNSPDLIVLPEAFSSGVGGWSIDSLPKLSNITYQFLESLSSDLGLAVCGSYACFDSSIGTAKALNRFEFWSSGELLATYDKKYLCKPMQEDKRYYSGRNLVEFQFKGLSIRPLICYDLRCPECFSLTDVRPDMYICVAAWPAVRAKHWRTLLKARAIETQSIFLGANRVGSDNGISFMGDSAIYGPRGENILSASSIEGVFFGSIDTASVSSWRQAFPLDF